MKVYELAKEVDIGAIDLVERIRSWGFAVRNHMTEVTAQIEERVRDLCRNFKKSNRSLISPKVILRKSPHGNKIVYLDNFVEAKIQTLLAYDSWRKIMLTCLESEAKRRFRFNDEMFSYWARKEIHKEKICNLHL